MDLLFVQDLSDFGEESLKSPHLLRVYFQQPRQQGSYMLLDTGTKKAGCGKLSVPLDGAVLGSLDSRDDTGGFFGGDVVHGLLVATSTKRAKREVSCGHVV